MARKTKLMHGIFVGGGTGFIVAIMGLSKVLRVKTEVYDRFIIPKGSMLEIIISILIFVVIGSVIGGVIGHLIKKGGSS